MHFAVIRLPSWALLQGFLGDLLNSCLYPRTLLGFLVRVFLVICPILAYLLFLGTLLQFVFWCRERERASES